LKLFISSSSVIPNWFLSPSATLSTGGGVGGRGGGGGEGGALGGSSTFFSTTYVIADDYTYYVGLKVLPGLKATGLKAYPAEANFNAGPVVWGILRLVILFYFGSLSLTPSGHFQLSNSFFFSEF